MATRNSHRLCLLLLLGACAAGLCNAGNDNYFSVDSISLREGELLLRVNPVVGGRISSLQLAGQELLYNARPANAPDNNWGSTFWISPQSLWGWPPIREHDSLPYRVLSLHGHAVALQSQSGSGARLTKYIALNKRGIKSVDLNYIITAEKDFSEIAAWEITRVRRDGLVFYPVASPAVTIAMGQVDYRIDSANVVWLQLRPERQPPQGKINAHGAEGWLAWICDGLLYVKIYPPVPVDQAATGEGDVEIYLSGGEPYVELEVQSAARALAAGEQLRWRVSWLLQELPEDLRVQPGSAALVQYVRSQVKAHRRHAQ